MIAPSQDERIFLHELKQSVRVHLNGTENVPARNIWTREVSYRQTNFPDGATDGIDAKFTWYDISPDMGVSGQIGNSFVESTARGLLMAYTLHHPRSTTRKVLRANEYTPDVVVDYPLVPGIREYRIAVVRRFGEATPFKIDSAGNLLSDREIAHLHVGNPDAPQASPTVFLALDHLVRLARYNKVPLNVVSSLVAFAYFDRYFQNRYRHFKGQLCLHDLPCDHETMAVTKSALRQAVNLVSTAYSIENPATIWFANDLATTIPAMVNSTYDVIRSSITVREAEKPCTRLKTVAEFK